MGVDCGEGCLHSSFEAGDVPLAPLVPFIAQDSWSRSCVYTRARRWFSRVAAGSSWLSPGFGWLFFGGWPGTERSLAAIGFSTGGPRAIIGGGSAVPHVKRHPPMRLSRASQPHLLFPRQLTPGINHASSTARHPAKTAQRLTHE